MASWGFLTNHARVLLCIAHDPGMRLRDIAARLDITERSAHGIITDLTEPATSSSRRTAAATATRSRRTCPCPNPRAGTAPSAKSWPSSEGDRGGGAGGRGGGGGVGGAGGSPGESSTTSCRPGRPFDPDSNYTSKYLDVANTPQYPFGYGLSCTTFALSNLHLLGEQRLHCGHADRHRGPHQHREPGQATTSPSSASMSRARASSSRSARLDGFQRVPSPRPDANRHLHAGAANLGFYNNQDSPPSNLAASTCTSATVTGGLHDQFTVR